ncbi:MAG: Prolyl-tRNA synthetase [Parcubacteria group bacterium GW2011_GWB1_38_8]|uniref:Proline--tRNA ligase n=1 Tax=Candidatus Zambryskibacteria bacterium RIFCSPLOWO2_02_FULL_39_14 TaxID=1802769 RepID=A0A1G2UGR2_9BACT|nr:MAG: Prolyl-tRNA synthetase [Parcubacteria group bacterium GW2011_GWB1_38_8]KKR30221.1 MAG: Prolyl-tRNA synthetase [Parcubacteria group bacterium GW2011_GWC1_39_8]OHA95489.1 MAG: prolyl-tRNA synthetase [Candidatus Zambryskibacteria bacterium RIFCSPHIGHO2_02_FULL_39_16]OHB08628.1 MAG: prolyl-tRNA synthetase [Candidatus Zambryskibacteria bacterium RIFCSPLOWO2_02_FULL_39_14]
MRQSDLFTKTRKEAPKDEVSKNAILLTRAGFINKEMAGVYSYLPLGLKVLKKIENIIREEMNALGGKELVLTSLQRKDVWEKVGRWDDKNVDVWFKTKLKDNVELGLGFTHDEQIVNLLTEYVSSYKDLPLYLYQIQTKFRNELRVKSGIMRGREFVMKDLYSFTRTEEEQDEFYEKAKKSYMKVFSRCGIGDITFCTFASGGTFSKYSHEFQTLSLAGEDIIYVDEKKNLAINKDVFDEEGLVTAGLKRDDLVERKSIEVGNIFKQGTKYTDPFNLYYQDENGKKQSILMGGYGIGVTRLMGTVVEVLSDDKGIIWPEEISPFQVHLVSLGNDENVIKLADEIYKTFQKEGIEVLYDDRNVRAGEKFADSDLIGISTRLVIGDKALESKKLEVKDRSSGQTTETDLKSFIKKFKK